MFILTNMKKKKKESQIGAVRYYFTLTKLADWKPGECCKSGEDVVGQVSLPTLLIRV